MAGEILSRNLILSITERLRERKTTLYNYTRSIPLYSYTAYDRTEQLDGSVNIVMTSSQHFHAVMCTSNAGILSVEFFDEKTNFQLGSSLVRTRWEMISEDFFFAVKVATF